MRHAASIATCSLLAQQPVSLFVSKKQAHVRSGLQVMLDNTAAELADTRRQLSAVDAERTAAAKRSSTLLTQWEERDLARDEELSKLRWVHWHGIMSACIASMVETLRQPVHAYIHCWRC
jgi:hypothetical protein